MNCRAIAVATGAALALLAAVSTTGAGVNAGREIRITTSGEGQSVITGKFTLSGTNAADSDSGGLRYDLGAGKYGKTAGGLIFTNEQWSETLKGKRGTLRIRVSGRRYPVVKDDEAAFVGMWSIVSGTGGYARWKGGGGAVGVHQTATRIIGVTISYRYEGTVTSS
jgi:hypothetical protein